MVSINYVSIFLFDSKFNERNHNTTSGTGLVLAIRRKSKGNIRQVRPTVKQFQSNYAPRLTEYFTIEWSTANQ
jgi:hypothetical protein